MKKSLYSLSLMDSVVAEIDRLAARQGTSRSNLVNQILADYASMMTPEKRIDSIFRRIETLAQQGDLIPYFTPNQRTMSLKSSLEYKYRPTIRYELQLYRVPEGAIGELERSIPHTVAGAAFRDRRVPAPVGTARKPLCFQAAQQGAGAVRAAWQPLYPQSVTARKP